MDKPTTSAPGGAAQKIEKQARQLAYDVRYKVRKAMKSVAGSRMDPASVSRAYMAELAKSKASSAVKARAKQMLLGSKGVQEHLENVDELVENSIANALYKVFVEGVEKNTTIELDYLNELYSKTGRSGEKLYHIRVTDKKTGNTYTRWADRQKISELRANPNIESVEMSELDRDTKRENEKGEYTARVKSGKGLDPVGKEDSDVNNDGKVDKTDKYLKHRRDVRGDAIEKRKGVSESFLGEVTDQQANPDVNQEPIDVMIGKNNVKINPEIPGSAQSTQSPMQLAHYEPNGPFITEKAVSKAQQKFMGMVYAAKKGEEPASPEVAKAAAGMSKGEAKKFAKTKHKGLPVHKEETDCGCPEEERDTRGDYAKIAMVKNKLRAMGMKNPIVMSASYEPEGEVLDELRRSEKMGMGSPETRSKAGVPLEGSRGRQKRQGALGGRHQYSGGSPDVSRSALERGKKKNEPGSQQQRLNPPEQKGRQLSRGSEAARQRLHSARD